LGNRNAAGFKQDDEQGSKEDGTKEYSTLCSIKDIQKNQILII